MPLADLSATDLLESYRSGELSPVEATDAALERIRVHDEAVNAMCLIDADGARAAAEQSAARWRAGEPVGALDGVPMTIKDLLPTTGWPTLRGSRLIDAAGPWTEDAPSVARVREAGAVLLGKTTTPEFGWKGVTDNPLTGSTGNPWAPGLTSGGSSGGSAAAVALGMGPLSLGTDGGGSVRIPAAFSGIVGHKPTYGVVPLYPTSPFGTLAHVGPMTRTVADAALLMDVITGFDSRDWSAMPTPAGSFRDELAAGIQGLNIAYSPTLGFVDVDPEVAESVRAAVAVLERLGATVDEVDPGFGDPRDAFHTLWFAGAAKVLSAYDRERWSEIDPGLREIVEAGERYSAGEFLGATQVRADLGLRMGAFHERYDLLVTPAMPITAFERGLEVPPGSGQSRWTEWTGFTYPFNLTQQPAISVPCGLSAAGLPIGLQFVGPRHRDALVLRAAAAYEEARGRFPSPPALG